MTYIYEPSPSLKVSYFLYEDHLNILQLLKESRSESSNPTEKQQTFHKLYRLLERHFYLEEKAIFVFFQIIKDKPSKEIQNHLREHDFLLYLMNRIMEKKRNVWQELIDLLTSKYYANKRFEEEYIYPLLDSVLSNRDQHKLTDLLDKTKESGYFPIQRLRNQYHFF